MSLVAFMDGKILLPKLGFRKNGNRHPLKRSMLYTPYGILLPLSHVAFDLVDYIEGTREHLPGLEARALVAAILNADGTCYEFLAIEHTAIAGKVVVYPRKLPAIQELTFAACGQLMYEEQMYMAMHLASNLEEAFKLLCKATTTFSPATHEIVEIKDLLAELQIAGCTAKMPLLNMGL